MQAGLQQASTEEPAFRAAYRSQLSSRQSPARDRDGFRKLLLVRPLTRLLNFERRNLH
jgi:hypothetical protein